MSSSAVRHRILSILAVALLSAGLGTGCVTNPVTGERDLNFYGEDWEVNVGRENYAPMRQAQGGDYVLDEDLTAYVQRVGARVASQSDRELPYEFEVLNSSVPNAWALPGGKIAINRGLLTELESEAELAAVLGHEVVHAAAAHGAQQQSKGMVLQGGSLIVGVLGATRAETQAGQQIAMILPQVGAQLINQKYSRDAEREADRYGMVYMSEAGYDPEGAVELQETFVRLSENRRQDWLSGLFASHPPSQERVERNRAMAEELPDGGKRGRSDYQRQMAYLERMQPAYEAFDAGRQALAAKDLREAEQQARRALAQEPREAMFHSLLGDIELAREDYSDARPHYDRAVRRDPSFFYHHLRRGQVRMELGDRRGAEQDLERSMELLPTSQASLLLGNIAEQAGRRDDAVAYYQLAAQSGSPSAGAARERLASLTGQQQAGARTSGGARTGGNSGGNTGRTASGGLSVEVIPDRQGNLYARISNPTRHTVTAVQLRVQWRDNRGQVREGNRISQEVLRPRGQSVVALGLRADSAEDLRRNIRVDIVRVATARR